MKIKIICPRCKSDQVVAEGILLWSVEKQDWEIQNILDSKYCNECGYEGVSVDEAEVEENA